LAATHGRDPNEMLERYQRVLKEGVDSYWAAGETHSIKDLGEAKKRVDVGLASNV